MRRAWSRLFSAALLLIVGVLLFVRLQPSIAPLYDKICAQAGKADHTDCAAYELALVVLWHLATFFEDHDGAITAVFTIVLALSTLFLWRSTNRLWKAAAVQSDDMKKTIAEAIRSANAMENVARAVEVSASIAQESSATLKDVTARQMRAYLSVLVHGGSYQERSRNIKFEARPALINTGHTPAHKVTYRAKADVLPFPLADDYVFSDPEDTLRSAAVLGPQQNFVLNAIVESLYEEEDVENIKRGRGRRVFIWGTVSYEDVFGVGRITNFCQSIYWINGPNGEMVYGNFHGRHNDAT
jgi:hypothetical protein